jgi:hypothetical protein
VIPDTPCPVRRASPARVGYDDEKTGTAIDVIQSFLRGQPQRNSSSVKSLLRDDHLGGALHCETRRQQRKQELE